ncbi:MAG: hypothetical protein AAF329_04655 [Cyanobacteria bacterium P01_A01_bin.17]
MAALMTYDNTYSSILKDAAKINWRVQDLINAQNSLDFFKPFLPEGLAHTGAIARLSSGEQLKLNQIRGNSYLYLFSVLEEAILPLVVNHIQAIGSDEIEATQAFLGFASEESKHIHLFRRFAEAFEAGFGSPCDCIGPSSAIARFILQHSSLGVALMTLHIEWMTQRHFLESVRDSQRENLDPQFCSLLKHHWQEEAQHARLDTLMVQSMARDLDAAAIATGIDDYIAVIQYLNAGLINQVQLDIDSLERVMEGSLSLADREAIQQQQTVSYQQTFLVAGMTHPNFVESVRALGTDGYDLIAEATQAFS